jgi:hypothetical protein
MTVERRLVPVLREGVDVIKMIFFRQMRIHLSAKYPREDVIFVNRLAGAILNDLFGTPNLEEPYASFARENRDLIESELRAVGTHFERMRIPLTDALRVQFLCDHQEGVDSTHILERARDLDILLVDREVPLPAKFIHLARKLGEAHDLLARRR